MANFGVLNKLGVSFFVCIKMGDCLLPDKKNKQRSTGEEPLDLSKSDLSPQPLPQSHFFTISSLTSSTPVAPSRQRASSSSNDPDSENRCRKSMNDGCRRRSSSMDDSTSSSSSLRPSQASEMDCVNPRMRRHPSMTPTEVKDAEYWEKRVRNNAAARRSRQSRRIKEVELTEYARKLEHSNAQLSQEVQRLREELAIIKSSHKRIGKWLQSIEYLCIHVRHLEWQILTW